MTNAVIPSPRLSLLFSATIALGLIFLLKTTWSSSFRNFDIPRCSDESALQNAREVASGKLVLVTGVAGFIGSHVAKQCLELNMTVVGVDDMSGGFETNLPVDRRFSFVKLDVRDANKVDQLLSDYKFHAVYHLAAYAAEGMSHFIRAYNYKTNLVGSVQLLNSAVKSGVKVFVFTSSIAVYGTGRTPLREDMVVRPEDPYGVSKYAMELDLQAAKVMFGIDHVIFRPHNVYGPGQNVHDRYRNVVGIFFNQLLRNLPMTIFGNGKQTRAFSYIDSVARPIALSPFVAAARNRVLNIGGDKAYEVSELARVVGKVWDNKKNPAIKHLDARHEVMHAQADHRKLKCVFGSAATDGIDLESGLRRTSDWLRSRGAKLTAPIEFSEVEVLKNMPPSWRTGELEEKPGIELSGSGSSRDTEEKRIQEIFGETKATKETHCYSWMYAQLFAPMSESGRGKNLRLLEIGIDRGGSLRLWQSIFPKAEIHGLENGRKHGQDTLQKQVEAAAKDGLTLHVGSQENLDVLQAVKEKTPGGIDIIIDDGGHSSKQQQTSLKNLWEHVRPGGMYIVEDLETQYYRGRGFGCYGAECGGGDPGAPNTTISLVKSFVDVLNRDFIGGPSKQNTQFVIGEGSFSKILGDWDMASVTCYRNLCAMRKKRGDEFVEGARNGCKSRQKPTKNVFSVG
eukprot:Plantae.Rhodophyta-Hildenbrandia_rubra.ctg1730.p1 GENE.Plantae.Rhodophyta-Hildenbrandia_rubra.ctg1730~~Plantae.Rhodophyta-Hildenbrandia_rubra.ctg1730.p1  ORF type:complete len:680 (+),score=115.87 Plantae.Rhodophyta-Hildenbrandia_rubra.ctg1730:2284-4323(+)